MNEGPLTRLAIHQAQEQKSEVSVLLGEWKEEAGVHPGSRCGGVRRFLISFHSFGYVVTREGFGFHHRSTANVMLVGIPALFEHREKTKLYQLARHIN